MFFVSRRHHDDVVRGLERQIEILADQIDWLRLSLGTPSLRPPVNPTEQPPVGVEVPFVSEEEEDLQYLHKSGQITDFELERALEQVGFLSTSIDSL